MTNISIYSTHSIIVIDNYIASIERLKNTKNGAPRYQVTVISKDLIDKARGDATVFRITSYEDERAVAKEAIDKYKSLI